MADGWQKSTNVYPATAAPTTSPSSTSDVPTTAKPYEDTRLIAGRSSACARHLRPHSAKMRGWEPAFWNNANSGVGWMGPDTTASSTPYTTTVSRVTAANFASACCHTTSLKRASSIPAMTGPTAPRLPHRVPYHGYAALAPEKSGHRSWRREP